MKPKNFSPEIWGTIETATQLAIENESCPIAAFDADGTLWNTDLGEAFFRYQIANLNLPVLHKLPTDPWTYYRNWKSSGDPRPAYLWLAQINQGYSLTQVRKWAIENVKKMSPLPIFEPQRQLISYFLKMRVKVFVVTASVKWAVEPGANLLGIPQEQVLGVATKNSEGIISDAQDGFITYRQGKVDALLDHNSGQKPFFCCGNTTGDSNLLASASKLSLAVCSSQEGDELFQSERLLQEEAKKHGWLTHQF